MVSLHCLVLCAGIKNGSQRVHATRRHVLPASYHDRTQAVGLASKPTVTAKCTNPQFGMFLLILTVPNHGSSMPYDGPYSLV